MNKTDMINWLRERAGGCAVQEWGPKYLQIADLLESGEIVKELQLPVGCTYWQCVSTCVPTNGIAYPVLVAYKPEPCGTDYLDIMEPGPFMWEGNVYWLDKGDTFGVYRGGRQCAFKSFGEWQRIAICFGTDNISGLNAKTVQRVKEWT